MQINTKVERDKKPQTEESMLIKRAAGASSGYDLCLYKGSLVQNDGSLRVCFCEVLHYFLPSEDLCVHLVSLVK